MVQSIVDLGLEEYGVYGLDSLEGLLVKVLESFDEHANGPNNQGGLDSLCSLHCLLVLVCLGYGS